MRSGIWGDRSSIGADQNENLLISKLLLLSNNFEMKSGILGDRSSIGTDQNENLIFIQLPQDEIRHLRGQIKPKVRSK